MKVGELPRLLAAAEAKGYKAGLEKAAEEADDMAAEFANYAALWKASFQDARRTGSELEAQESVGRLLTWKEAKMALLNQAARLRAIAEKG